MSLSSDKTVYIHIGYYKTGTTAIQQFCAANPELLSHHRVAYLDAGRPEGNPVTHSLQPLLILKAHGFSTPRWFNNRRANLERDPDEVLRAMASEVALSDRKVFVVSSEEYVQFCELPDAEAQIRKIVDAFTGYRVMVLAYLREPVAYLESWYNQLIRMWAPLPGFCRFVLTQRECHFNYDKAVSAWGDVVGTQNVVLRRYSRSGARHIQDFFACLGADIPASEIAEHMARARANERLDDRAIELLRVINLIDAGRSYAQSVGQDGLIDGDSNGERQLESRCERINRRLDALSARYAFDGARSWHISPEDVRNMERRINWLRKSPDQDACTRRLLFRMGKPLVLLVRTWFFIQAAVSKFMAAWRPG